MECLYYWWNIVLNLFELMANNSEWICAIALVYFAYKQYKIALIQQNISLKQKNLALLEKRLSLKNRLETYLEEILKNCMEPQLNIKILKETYDKLTNISGDAFLLFNKNISEQIMDLAKNFEILKTAIHYHILKNRGENVKVYENKDADFEKDYGKIHANIIYKMNILLTNMHILMRENEI